MLWFSDDEIYGRCIHYFDEDHIDIGKEIKCNVVVNHHVELTEEEKAEARQKAIRQYQEEEIQKMKNRKRLSLLQPRQPQHQPYLISDMRPTNNIQRR